MGEDPGEAHLCHKQLSVPTQDSGTVSDLQNKVNSSFATDSKGSRSGPKLTSCLFSRPGVKDQAANTADLSLGVEVSQDTDSHSTT